MQLEESTASPANAEAARELTVCNACRYCEGYCAMFPAMETLRKFDKADVIYLANLCFECRACYYACQFAPPHEYGINIPQALAAVRAETYAEFTGPRLLSRLYRGNERLVWATVALSIALIFGGVLAIQGSGALFAAGDAPGAFYAIVPYLAMLLPALLLAGWWLAAFAVGAWRFWRALDAPVSALFEPRALLRSGKDALSLEYLKGGADDGCPYPTAAFSMSRRYLHQALVAGVLLDFASTSVAAFYDHFLDRQAPYPYLSLPVLLGIAGGVLILAGCAGLLALKRNADPAPADAGMVRQDVVFLWLLLATAATGLLLLLLRASAAMGTLLTVHLGIVAALFLTLPYGKLAHAVYRYAALIRWQQSQPES